jgi:hypothetical protein
VVVVVPSGSSSAAAQSVLRDMTLGLGTVEDCHSLSRSITTVTGPLRDSVSFLHVVYQMMDAACLSCSWHFDSWKGLGILLVKVFALLLLCESMPPTTCRGYRVRPLHIDHSRAVHHLQFHHLALLLCLSVHLSIALQFWTPPDRIGYRSTR